MRRLLFAISIFVLALTLQPVSGVTRTVCASGCDFTTIQAAVNAAVAGDVINIAAGETFTGSVTFPNKGALATPITIRSNTADGNLPAAGNRVTPDFASVMPDIQASGGGVPAFTFAPGAQDYTLLGLEFKANPSGFGTIIEVGSASTDQQFASDQPQDIVIDRCLIRGDPIFGQKVGVDLSGRNLSVINSWIDRIAGVGQDAIAVRVINGTGPFTVVNNLIEGAAENMLSGGLDPQMRTFAEVASGATTTQATLQNFRAGHTIATLREGMLVAVLAGANTTRHHTIVRNIVGNTITYDPIPSAPDTGTGSDIRWGEMPENFTIRRNHFRKPTAWMNAILGTMTQPTLSATSGSLAAGTYCYRLSALNANGYNNNTIFSTASTERCITLSSTGGVSISWSANANATSYRVYGRLGGAPTGYLATSGTSVTDSGASLTAGSVPSGTKWVVKNLFEIKFGRNFQIDSNIFEYSWHGSDIGYAIWLKSNNTGNSCEHCETKDVMFEKNIVRNVVGLFNILGKNDGGAESPAQVRNLTIRNNLLYNSNTTWTGQGGTTVYAFKIQRPTTNVGIIHNTVINTMRGFMYLTESSTGPYHTNLVVRDNIGRAETYGVFSTSCVKGTECLVEQTNGYTFAGNVLAGASASTYPAGNLYPSVTEFESAQHFVDYDPSNGDYSLVLDSSWRNSATDGSDRGANISEVLAATSGVIDGTPESSTPTINITTQALNNGTQNVAYNATLSASGGVTPYTWSTASGSLPAGLTLSAAGVISGTPTNVQTASFTVMVTDSTGGTPLTDTQALSLQIVSAPVSLNITTTTLPDATVPLAYSTTLAATGGTPPYSWNVSAGTPPAGITLGTNGVLAGTPSVAGTYNFTARVTDFGGITDTQALTLIVNQESRPCDRPIRWNLTEVAVFRRSTPPTAKDCVIIGDIWINTSTSPPSMLFSTSISPSITWEPINVGSAHSLLSHSDSASTGAVASAGDLIVGTDESQWTRLPAGGEGDILTTTGGVPSWSPPVTTGSGGGGSGASYYINFLGDSQTASFQWTDMPAAETDFDGTVANRRLIDLTGTSTARMFTRTVSAAASGSQLKFQYNTNTTCDTCSTGWVDIATVTLGTSGNPYAGALANIPTAAKTLVYVRIVGVGGNATADPAFTYVAVQIK